MKKIFYSICAIGSSFLYAQDYKAINPDRAYSFSYKHTGANYEVVGFKVDSITSLPSEEVYHFNKTYVRNSMLCYELGSTWIGPHCISHENQSMDVFSNKNREAIIISRNAPLHEEWVCYSTPDLLVIAKVESITSENYMEGIDMVKTITFKVYTPSMEPLDYQLNGLSIKIAKNKGLVQALNFNEFPGGLAPSISLDTYIISGATNPAAGIPPLTLGDIYDFNINDEFHTVEAKYALPAVLSYYDTINTIAKVTNKIQSFDSTTLIFKDDLQYIVVRDDMGSISRNVSYGSEYRTLKFSKFDMPLPGAARVEGGKLLFYTQSYSNGKMRLITTSPGTGAFHTINTDFCINNLFCETSDEVNFYIDGLGGPYFNLPRCYIKYWGWNKELIYYKKNSIVEEGTPLNLGGLVTSSSNPHTTSTAMTWPNPFVDKLVIDNSSSAVSNIDIIDVYGNHMVSEQSLDSGNWIINTSEYPSGIYFLSYTDAWGHRNNIKISKN